MRKFSIREVTSLNETITCLQSVCSWSIRVLSEKLIQNPMLEPGVLNRRDMSHGHAYMTMPKFHSLTLTLGWGMENYKKQTGRCFRMEILEATNTMPMGKHDYQQCRFEIYCQNRRILRREKIYFGKVNFRPSNKFGEGYWLSTQQSLVAAWGKRRWTSSSSSTPGWEPIIRARSLRKTLVAFTPYRYSLQVWSAPNRT